MSAISPVHLGRDEHRERAERLFEEALALPQEERRRFIAAACGDDGALATELLSLLEHAKPGEQFFGRLARVVTAPTIPSTVNAGRYEIQGLIGAGGMGAVYRAHDTRLNRDVALKFLPPHLSRAPGAEGRLLQEARAAAGLEHINICTVYEIGETDDGRSFIAMAFYDGATLKERLTRGPLAAREAVDIALQVARGLGAAHAHGIVHRDVKPGNIMLTAAGTVKLLDFGLATVPDAHATPGSTPGTVPYMSPEQTRGESVGIETDLWSLGVVMHEMLTGVRPFDGARNDTIIHAIRHSSPEPLGAGTRAGATSPSLEGIVERLLQKEPDRRYRCAEELLGDLTQELAVPGGTPKSSHAAIASRRVQTMRLLAASFVVATSAGAAWWSTRHVSRPRQQANGVATLMPRTLALLPFTNADHNSGSDYLTEGLTQQLTTALSKVHAVRVISRASALNIRADQHDLQQVGRTLKVSALLVGAVRSSSGHLRVDARVVNVADGAELWSGTYEGTATQIAALPRELALGIASALGTRLSPGERDRLERPGTKSQDALAFYLKGRYFWNQRTVSGYRLALDYFAHAIAADSQYAAPWAGLAAVYSQQGMNGQLPPEQAQQRSRAAVLRAIALDDSLAEAHAVLGAYMHSYDWDAEGAERELRRAIELDPNYALARHYYCTLLRSIGRLDEAIAQETAAVELDPLVPAFNETLAFMLLTAGRPGEALNRLRTALELDSTYWRAHAVLGLVFEVTHRYNDAIREYERANQLAGPTGHRTTGDLARVLARMGRVRDARQLLAVLQARAARANIYEPAVATAFHALGDDATAYDWLEHAYRQRQPELRFILGDPRFLEMAAEPRLRNLLQRLRLPN